MSGKSFALTVFVLAGCASTPEVLPEPQLQSSPHADYAKYRPVSIAVMPVHCVRQKLAPDVRRTVYRGLVDKHYSPFSLQIVDERIDRNGKFNGDGLQWDALLRVYVEKWRPVHNGVRVLADGSAQLVHSTGTLLWSLRFKDQVFEARNPKGGPGEHVAAQNVGRMVLEQLPGKPPLRRE